MNTGNLWDVLLMERTGRLMTACGIAVVLCSGANIMHDTVTDVTLMLLGAGFVILGVLVSALADRIRGTVKTTYQTPAARVSPARAPRDRAAASPLSSTSADAAMNADAISALCNLGYNRKEAAAAVADCQGSQRATLDSLIRACLRALEGDERKGCAA